MSRRRKERRPWESVEIPEGNRPAWLNRRYSPPDHRVGFLNPVQDAHLPLQRAPIDTAEPSFPGIPTPQGSYAFAPPSGYTYPTQPWDRLGDKFPGYVAGQDSRSSEPHLSSINAVFHNKNPRNITVHLKLPVIDDIEDELEEFSILRRLGNFKAAKSYFQEKLKNYQNVPFVFVQYAQMLLDSGDFKGLSRLRAQEVFSEEHLQGSGQAMKSQTMSPILRQWTLIEKLGILHNQGTMEAARSEAHDVLNNWRVQGTMGEILLMQAQRQIQIVSLTLRIFSHIFRAFGDAYHGDRVKRWMNWETLLRSLLTQGRAWDFRDIAIYLSSASVVVPKDIIDTWRSHTHDESTCVALLDIHVAHGLEAWFITQEDLDHKKSTIKSADTWAEEIRSKYPQAMRSRSYLRWILLKSAELGCKSLQGLTNPHSALENSCKSFPGQTLYCKGTLNAFYIPKDSENPGWCLPEAPVQPNAPVHAVLKASEQLQDLSTQAMTYRLIALRSASPLHIFQKLASLQKSESGDSYGRMETLLSSYLSCEERTSKQWLFAQLKDTDDWTGNYQLRDPLIFFARDCVQRAIDRNLHGTHAVSTLRTESWRYYQWLPVPLQRFIDGTLTQGHIPLFLPPVAKSDSRQQDVRSYFETGRRRDRELERDVNRQYEEAQRYQRGYHTNSSSGTEDYFTDDPQDQNEISPWWMARPSVMKKMKRPAPLPSPVSKPKGTNDFYSDDSDSVQVLVEGDYRGQPRTNIRRHPQPTPVRNGNEEKTTGSLLDNNKESPSGPSRRATVSDVGSSEEEKAAKVHYDDDYCDDKPPKRTDKGATDSSNRHSELDPDIVSSKAATSISDVTSYFGEQPEERHESGTVERQPPNEHMTTSPAQLSVDDFEDIQESVTSPDREASPKESHIDQGAGKACPPTSVEQYLDGQADAESDFDRITTENDRKESGSGNVENPTVPDKTNSRFLKTMSRMNIMQGLLGLPGVRWSRAAVSGRKWRRP